MGKTILLTAILFISSNLMLAQKIINLDFAIEKGIIKDILGGNKGGEVASAKPYLDGVGINSIRIHDYHYKGGDYYAYSDFWNKDANGDYIDINTSFNPNNPTHYHWNNTDKLITSILSEGYSIYFRIGTSYPSNNYVLQPQYPPSNTGGNSTDFSKFAQLAANTVKHYNNGWNNGFNNNIEYWEIWNEPNGLFWEGNPIQFFEMYKAVSIAIKANNPNVKVGALGSHTSTTYSNNATFREDFIRYCNANNLALDFYSWHVYGMKNPYGLMKLNNRVKTTLNNYNYPNTESHISEINAFALTAGGLHDLIRSAKGATYYLSLLLTAQEAGISKMFIYPSNIIFKETNSAALSWTKSANALKAFNHMRTNAPIIVQSSGNEVILNDLDDESLNFMILASKNASNEKLYIIVSNFASNNINYQIKIANLPWEETSATKVTKTIINEANNFTETIYTVSQGVTSLNIGSMNSPSVLFLILEGDDGTNVDAEAQDDILIFPTPTTNDINITFNEEVNSASIEIQNIVGKTILKTSVQNKKLQNIDISNFENGIYIINVKTNNSVYSSRIVKQ